MFCVSYITLTCLFRYIQIRHCLEEWSTGTRIMERFNGIKYGKIYKAIKALLLQVEEDDYHSEKLEASLRDWAQSGGYIYKHWLNICSHMLAFLDLALGYRMTKTRKIMVSRWILTEFSFYMSIFTTHYHSIIAPFKAV